MKNYGLNYRRNSGDQESFWPSFADIMMLFVMIFLMVMVVLLIKNSDLAGRLTEAAQTSEKLTSKQQLLTNERDLLKRKLLVAEKEISRLNIAVMNKDSEKAKLQLELSSIGAENKIFEKSLLSKQDELDATAQELSRSKKDLEESLQSKQRLLSNIENLQSKSTRQELQFKKLKRKYDRLLRPARSSKGRYAVEISYISRLEKTPQIALKQGSGAYKIVSKTELHKILKSLKNSQKQGLYLKIVFPEGNRVTHEEAWIFTNDLLQRYDYYYQGDA